MEELIAFIFIGLIMELLFWGILYTTGRFIIYIVSFGKWKAKPRLKNKENLPAAHSINKSTGVLIDAIGVCLIGFFFWMIVIALIIWI
jgi:hypothetical protein